jgi:hypothetical protein
MSPKFALAALTLVIALSSCLSTGPDQFISKNLSPEEKSEIIFQKGLALYNEKLMEKNDLKAIPEVRSYFEAALQADPANLKAQEYLAKTDSFKSLRFAGFVKTAKALKEKKNRTESEDYELVLATQRAQDLNALDGEIIKLKAETADLRKQVIQKRVAKLAELEKKLKAEKNATEIAKLVPQTTKLIGEIQQIDPANKDAGSVKKSLDEIVASTARKDIDEAKAKLAKKQYAEAEVAALRANKTMAGVSKEGNPEVNALMYDIYYAWAGDLYAAKKYESANSRVSQAIAVSRTNEALDLKTKIAKAAAAGAKPVAAGAKPAAQPVAGTGKPAATAAPAARDYDAEIDDMLQTVDSAIARGDLPGAWDLINANVLKVKQQANKDKLTAKKAVIEAKMKTLYADSVAAYNDEDYETARDGFRMIVKINPGYEQAQAYLDRANTKIRALAGDN